jgi:fructose-bisphosphate aldolase class I
MMHDLETIAREMVAPGKGILAADESFGTIEKRFKSIKQPATEENRRSYREMLFTTPDIGDYISGVITFDETLRHRAEDGTPFPELLRAAGVIPGIKVDTGAKALAGYPGEKVTEGLDGLRERLAEYYELGARFTKWRAVITIGHALPTRFCVDTNAHWRVLRR